MAPHNPLWNVAYQMAGMQHRYAGPSVPSADTVGPPRTPRQPWLLPAHVKLRNFREPFFSLVSEGRMADLEGLVARHVREAGMIATAAKMTPAPDLTTQTEEWVRLVKEHADALPADQGPALLARIVGRLKARIASDPHTDEQRSRTLQALARRLSANAS
jgi:hypothetical protein